MGRPVERHETPRQAGWRKLAACRGKAAELIDVFFPVHGSNERTPAICETCPVRAQCIAYAIDNRETQGVWGATTRERDRLAKARRLRVRSGNTDERQSRGA